MKKSSEYRALAWKEYRTYTSQSIGIAGIALLIGAVVAAVLFVAFRYLPKTTVSIIGTASIITAAILCLCIINYYLPLCFLSLVRKQEVNQADIRCSNKRALLAALIMFVPSIVQSIAGVLAKAYEQSALMSLIAIALYCVCIWWSYAICSMFPYVANDNQKQSVWAAVKNSITIMNGYKWKLFCVDFKIFIWPIVIILVITILSSAFGILSGGKSFVLIGIAFVLFAIAMIFVLLPMWYIARACYYEDLRAESNSKAVATDEDLTPQKRARANLPNKTISLCVFAIIAILLIGLCIKNKDSINAYRSELCYNRILNLYPPDSTKTDKILRLCDKGIALNQNNYKHWLTKGLILTFDKEGQIDEACACFKQAIEIMEATDIKEGKEGAYVAYVYSLRQVKRYEEAFQVASKGLKEFPNSKRLMDEQHNNYLAYCDYLLTNSEDLNAIIKMIPIISSIDKNREIELCNKCKLLIKDMCANADEMLKNSKDTKAMWDLSTNIWNIDRKRGLNLRRKCARLKDQQARDWFISKGYEWD